MYQGRNHFARFALHGMLLAFLWLGLSTNLFGDSLLTLHSLWSHAHGRFDKSAAEVVTCLPQQGRVYVTNADENCIDVLNLRTGELISRWVPRALPHAMNLLPLPSGRRKKQITASCSFLILQAATCLSNSRWVQLLIWFAFHPIRKPYSSPMKASPAKTTISIRLERSAWCVGAALVRSLSCRRSTLSHLIHTGIN